MAMRNGVKDYPARPGFFTDLEEREEYKRGQDEFAGYVQNICNKSNTKLGKITIAKKDVSQTEEAAVAEREERRKACARYNEIREQNEKNGALVVANAIRTHVAPEGSDSTHVCFSADNGNGAVLTMNPAYIFQNSQYTNGSLESNSAALTVATSDEETIGARLLLEDNVNVRSWGIPCANSYNIMLCPDRPEYVGYELIRRVLSYETAVHAQQINLLDPDASGRTTLNAAMQANKEVVGYTNIYNNTAMIQYDAMKDGLFNFLSYSVEERKGQIENDKARMKAMLKMSYEIYTRCSFYCNPALNMIRIAEVEKPVANVTYDDLVFAKISDYTFYVSDFPTYSSLPTQLTRVAQLHCGGKIIKASDVITLGEDEEDAWVFGEVADGVYKVQPYGLADIAKPENSRLQYEFGTFLKTSVQGVTGDEGKRKLLSTSIDAPCITIDYETALRLENLESLSEPVSNKLIMALFGNKGDGYAPYVDPTPRAVALQNLLFSGTLMSLAAKPQWRIEQLFTKSLCEQLDENGYIPKAFKDVFWNQRNEDSVVETICYHDIKAYVSPRPYPDFIASEEEFVDNYSRGFVLYKMAYVIPYYRYAVNHVNPLTDQTLHSLVVIEHAKK